MMKPVEAAAMILSGQEYDNRLWTDFSNGDKEAFATLYHRYFKLLIQNSSKISGDTGMIKDCIHDLFVELWKNKKKLAVPRSVKAYLCVSIRRKIIRQVKKTRYHSLQSFLKEMPDSELDYSIEKKIINGEQRKEQQNNVDKALNTLTKRQKEAVYLKFYANLSYPEIADKMSISTDSIYNLVSKAIDNMQIEMTKISLQ